MDFARLLTILTTVRARLGALVPVQAQCCRYSGLVFHTTECSLWSLCSSHCWARVIIEVLCLIFFRLFLSLLKE
jgi:hypothetical protein